MKKADREKTTFVRVISERFSDDKIDARAARFRPQDFEKVSLLQADFIAGLDLMSASDIDGMPIHYLGKFVPEDVVCDALKPTEYDLLVESLKNAILDEVEKSIQLDNLRKSLKAKTDECHFAEQERELASQEIHGIINEIKRVREKQLND